MERMSFIHLAAMALSFAHVPAVIADVLSVPGEYSTIQSAIDAAEDGDVVELANGVYSGPGNTNVNLRGKEITVRSANGPANCIIDGEGVNRGFLATSGETSDTALVGLTIQNCYGDGAAIRINDSNLSVLGCRLYENVAEVVIEFEPPWVTEAFGPCFRITGGSATFRQCEFTNNYGDPVFSIGFIDEGGSAEFEDCEFAGNAAPAGGGVMVGSGNAWFKRCVFRENALSSTEYDGVSTCLMLSGASTVRLIGCEFVDNWTLNLSRTILSTGDLRMYNCVYRGNFSLAGAGANVYVNNTSDTRIVNCTFARYAPSGLGFAVEGDRAGEVSNCIMWNEGGGGAGVAGYGVDVQFSIVQGGWPGPGNQNADPLFIDSPDELRVQKGSPAIDMGLNSLFPTWLSTDFAGDPRVQGLNIDLGAYESPYEIETSNEVHGEDAGDEFGHAVTRIGDWDLDGVPDFAVASPYNDAGGEDAGAVEIYSGRTRQLLTRLEGSSPGVNFGLDVVGLDDLDGDGAGEIAIGAPGVDHPAKNAGAVYVYSSATGRSIVILFGERRGDHFGYSIDAALSPHNQFRRTDLIIGAPYNDANGHNSGKAYLYRCKDRKYHGSCTGDQAGERFGWSVAALDFVNEDLWPDFIVGAPYNNDRGDAAGKAYIFEGENLDLIRSRTGKRPGDQFGRHVAFAGWVDDDLHGDYIVSAPFYNTTYRSNAGRIYVYSGKDGRGLYSVFGAGSNEWFGYCVDQAGDLDGDGYTDLLVGAPFRPQNNGLGVVDVISGRDGDILDAFAGTENGNQFGHSVAMLGELNGWGELFMVVGAPLHDDNGEDAGYAEIILIDPP